MLLLYWAMVNPIQVWLEREKNSDCKYVARPLRICDCEPSIVRRHIVSLYLCFTLVQLISGFICISLVQHYHTIIGQYVFLRLSFAWNSSKLDTSLQPYVQTNLASLTRGVFLLESCEQIQAFFSQSHHKFSSQSLRFN